MLDYDYPEHYTASVLHAIKLAELLKASGRYDLFRGQRHTFPVQPSLFRPGVDQEGALEQLHQFANWANSTPDLESWNSDERSVLAVAQHYGLKTPLLDFSRSPRIAGFFASDEGLEGDTGTIICLNRETFNKSWEDINARYYEQEGRLLTEIIDIDVQNLWRLQAQECEFVRSHVDPSLLEMYSSLLHIYFPQMPGTVVLDPKDIYPEEKSHLEVLLDQYFLISSYPSREKEMEQIFGPVIHTVTHEQVKKDVEAYFKNDSLPEDDGSWCTPFSLKWLREPDERYADQKADQLAQLVIPSTDDPPEFDVFINNQLQEIVGKSQFNSRPSLRWSIVDEEGCALNISSEGCMKNESDEYTEFSVAEMVSVIYSGMRYLPYDDPHIIRSIARYLNMLSFGVYETIDDCEGVEFEGGSVRGRGYASKHRILGALRSDFYDLIKPERLDARGQMRFRDTLHAARYVKSSYRFDAFLELFVEDLIPSQAVTAVEGLTIGLNPMRIEILGES